jgi:amino acid transporter
VGENDVDLKRHFGLWQATALNIIMVVGAGVFVTIPPMLDKLPGPAALLGWLAAGLLVLVDSLVWSELGAALPGSGGSYVYLLESYGRQRWGRLMAFLFIWQFLLSGPLELASGLIATDAFAQAMSPAFARFNADHAWKWDLWAAQNLAVTVSPARLGCAALGLVLIVLLYRRVESLGRLTLLFGAGVLAACAWLICAGVPTFDAATAFARPAPGELPAGEFAARLGGAMVLALYSYLGYYNICYIGDEVRDPGRTIPRAILLSAALVCVLFVALHLAMLGTVPWEEARAAYDRNKDSYILPADFMTRVLGGGAARAVLLLLIVSCFASAFAGLLGYSRIPYGAARGGHFFAAVGRVHPRHRIPHVSLLLVGGLTLAGSFFDLENVIKALVTTRILGQFIAQAAGVVLLWRTQHGRARPFRMALYPLPCLLALGGWLYVWLAAGWEFVALSLVTLASGAAAFFLWAWGGGTWPFGARPGKGD